MEKKKRESVVEEIKELAEKGVEAAKEFVEEVVEEVKELVGDDKEKKKAKTVKEKKKSSAKKSDEEKSEEETNKKTSVKSKLELLKEKAKALEGKISEIGSVNIKEEVTGEKEEKKDTLVPMEDYLKSSIHLGTRVITPHMRPYVYRRRADGLAVFNTALLDDKIREGAEYLSQFAPEQIVVVCKREAGWQAVTKFAETVGVKYFTKKYPAGTLTNPELVDFFERDLLFICDPWIDKNALADAKKVKMKVLSICDTNNYAFGVDHLIPGNNKSAKSLGMIFYLLTKLYIEKRRLGITPLTIQEFVEGWDGLEPPK